MINNVEQNFKSNLKRCVTWKKCKSWEVWVKFYLGQSEDYSPGDSISESSEKLLQSRVGGQYICDFGEGGVCAIKPMFFCRRLLKLTDASIHQLLNCLPGSWLTIKIYFHYFYERTGYADTVNFSLPFMLLSPLHSLHILLISRMLDEKKVWTAVFSYKVFWQPISICSEMFILKVLFSRSRLDLKNQKFWEVVLAFWAGLSGDIEL